MNAKYKRGKKISSLDELMQQRFVIFEQDGIAKIYHSGWFTGWPLRLAKRYCETGVLYQVVSTEDRK